MKKAWKELDQNNSNGSLSTVIIGNCFTFYHFTYFLDCSYITFIINSFILNMLSANKFSFTLLLQV